VKGGDESDVIEVDNTQEFPSSSTFVGHEVMYRVGCRAASLARFFPRGRVMTRFSFPLFISLRFFPFVQRDESRGAWGPRTVFSIMRVPLRPDN
jgi:hypothetical protein